MCGVVVIVDSGLGSGRVRMEPWLSRLLDSPNRKAPDGRRVWFHPDLPVGLGDARLSVVNLSDADRRPMTSAIDCWTITCSGEIDNADEVAELLSGFLRHGRSDTEVLVEAMDRWSVANAQSRCIGRFARAARHAQNTTFWLGQYNNGQRPLDFGGVGGQFVSNTEFGAIERLSGTDLTIDKKAIRVGAIQRPSHLSRTVEGPRGQCDVPRPGSENYSLGGAESSIVSALAEQDEEPTRTFTVKNLDSPLLDVLPHAANLGEEHRELNLRVADRLNLAPRLGPSVTSPSPIARQCRPSFISQRVRENAALVLGGDEVLAGYNRYVWTRRSVAMGGCCRKHSVDRQPVGFGLCPTEIGK